jgi:hypothetical protein
MGRDTKEQAKDDLAMSPVAVSLEGVIDTWSRRSLVFFLGGGGGLGSHSSLTKQ